MTQLGSRVDPARQLMLLSQLKAFITVARQGSLTEAAALLGLTQPAVSIQMKALQQTLGVSMFQRTRAGMTLTHAGAALLPHAENILSSVEVFQLRADQIQFRTDNRLRAGVARGGSLEFMAQFSNRLSRQFPGTEVHFVTADSDDVLHDVKTGVLDLGLVWGAFEPGLISESPRGSVYRVVAGVRWSDRIRKKSWNELAEFTWIRTPATTLAGRLLAAKFIELGIAPQREIGAVDEQAAIDLAKSGRGLALIEAEVASELSLAGQVVVSSVAPLSSDLKVIALKAREVEPVIRFAVEALTAVSPSAHG